MPLLEVTDLDKTFTVDSRSVVAIDHLSLSIDEHEFVSIVGPSGCGKSTFLHIVGGFEPATGGDLRLNGKPIGPPGPDRGMMFQELSLFPWLTAIENVAWPLEMKGLPKRECRAKAADYLDLVHLSRFADLYLGQLSGGMKQRVALARLFALDPEIMLMDEPFGALDSQTRELLQEELQSIWRRARKTALFVTHDIDEAIYLGTRVIVFTARPGRIKADIRLPERRSLRRLPQVAGIPRLAGAGLGPAAGRGVEGAGPGGSVRINSASVQHWIVPVAVVVAWQVFGSAGLLPRYLSFPSAILAALWEITLSGELLAALTASLYRVSAGFVMGTVAGIIVGLGAGILPGVRHFFDPLVSFLYSIPKIAFLPVFLLLFGLGHASKIAIIAFSGFFPVFVASRHAVLSVNKLLIWAARNMGTPSRTIFFRVIIPAAAPQLFGGIRIGLAHAFVVLFAAELIGSKAGLGTIISYGEEWVRFDLMFAGIVCFAVLGFLSDRILLAIRARVLRGQMIGTEEQVVR